MMLRETEGRRKILALKDKPSIEAFLAEFARHGVRVLHAQNSIPSGDCRSYAIERSRCEPFRPSLSERERILGGTHPQVVLARRASPGLIVAYFDNPNLLSSYLHFGICVEVDDADEGKVMVESRWGCDEAVFIHPLEITPAMYGGHVEFLVPRKAYQP